MSSFSGLNPFGGAREAGGAPPPGRRMFRRTPPEDTPPRPRGAPGGMGLHAPPTPRALVRADEIWLVILAAFVGLGAGLCVTAMSIMTQYMHQVLFGIGPYERLSGQLSIGWWRVLMALPGGGLLMGLSLLALARWWPRR